MANKDASCYSLDSNGPISIFLRTKKATSISLLHTAEAKKLHFREVLTNAYYFSVSILKNI